MVLAVAGDIAAARRRRSASSTRRCSGSAGSTPWSTTPGIFIAKPFTEYTDDDFDAVTGVNLRGFFEVIARRRRGDADARAAATSSTSPPAWSTTPTQRCRRRWRP